MKKSTAPGRGARAWALGLLLVVYTSNFIDRSLLGVLGQPIKADLRLADWQLSRAHITEALQNWARSRTKMFAAANEAAKR